MKPWPKPLIGLLLTIVMLAGHEEVADAGPATARGQQGRRLVMTWVPPYGVEAARARLTESFGGLAMGDGLTHLALQFWTPTRDGRLARVGRYGDIDATTIAALRDWGHGHGLRLMLCVYNGVETWDWQLARAAFAGQPQGFASAVLAEVDRLGLDGVDLDLEGEGELEGDKEDFVRFVARLAARLHDRGQELTVASFPHVWNAPNQGWWPELLPLVDGLTSMGYEELGAKAPAWQAYAAQELAAGREVGKLLIGMPTHVGRWQGDEALTQLHWVRDTGKSGLALWDARLSAAAWRRRDVWSTIRQIRSSAGH